MLQREGCLPCWIFEWLWKSRDELEMLAWPRVCGALSPQLGIHETEIPSEVTLLAVFHAGQDMLALRGFIMHSPRHYRVSS
jgi:hypothetical protein